MTSPESERDITQLSPLPGEPVLSDFYTLSNGVGIHHFGHDCH